MSIVYSQRKLEYKIRKHYISCREFKTIQLARYYDLVKVSIWHLCFIIFIGYVLRVDYKLLLYTFYDHAPPYTCEMVTKYKPRRQLRSSGKCMLVVSKNRTKGYDARSFLYASATLCDNRLTEADSIAVFKGRLKSHIFNSYFS